MSESEGASSIKVDVMSWLRGEGPDKTGHSSELQLRRGSSTRDIEEAMSGGLSKVNF